MTEPNWCETINWWGDAPAPTPEQLAEREYDRSDYPEEG